MSEHTPPTQQEIKNIFEVGNNVAAHFANQRLDFRAWLEARDREVAREAK